MKNPQNVEKCGRNPDGIFAVPKKGRNMIKKPVIKTVKKQKKSRSNTAVTAKKIRSKAARAANIEDRLELPEIDLSKIEEINLSGPDLPDIEEIDFSKLELPEIEELEIDLPEIVLEDFKIDLGKFEAGQPKKKARKKRKRT